MNDWFSRGTMFASSFLSATLLPGSSEVLLVALLIAGNVSVPGIIFCAALANTLGGLTNIIIGRILPQGRWQGTAQAWLSRWGSAVLLMSWLPVIGDVLCVLTGWLRLSWLAMVFFLAAGKTLRYVVVAFVTLHGME